MVRAPCCEKMGLKKGPWTREEDQILINYITLYGHGNWRALPKLAGLLRCGKSCRLRWTNYLRPDIKRGNFSREEEETIIQLHAALGNRWSAIAARLPGRTDNEIKNVWHTHLKKRVNKPNNATTNTQPKQSLIDETPVSKFQDNMEEDSKEEEDEEEQVESSSSSKPSAMNSSSQLNSPQHSYSEISSSATNSSNSASEKHNMCMDSSELVLENFPEMDEDFWSEVLSGVNSGEFLVVHGGSTTEVAHLPEISYDQSGAFCGYKSNMNDDMDFWLHVFTRAEDLPELPQNI